MRSVGMAQPSLRLFFLALLGWAGVPASGTVAAAPPSEPISIRFEQLSPRAGLMVSVSVPGDADGATTFSNETCCAIEDARRFADDVRIYAGGRALRVIQGADGWSARHEPHARLTVAYRLLPSGPTRIDGGTPEQMRPLIHGGLFHLVGRTALLLPVGRSGSDPVVLDIDAAPVASSGQFVSSFGPGITLARIRTTRRQVVSALYLGGGITLSLHDTATGNVGIVHSGMENSVLADELRKDALSIVEAERAFFDDAQPWYLVSVHGGPSANPDIKLGGGIGLTNAFAMFVDAGLDFSNPHHREPFRWVLAHEYFHQWNGLTLRVASRPGSERDDTSVYWFSEGVTDFYAMRLLTRAGLQPPERSLAVLNNRLQRYARNSKRGMSAKEAGELFWTDPDGEQVPYLRGYLAAWVTDLSASRASTPNAGLDPLMKTLVKRAKAEPEFRVDNTFLASYLSAGLPADDRARLRRFLIEGGDVPLASDSFGPCLSGGFEPISGLSTLQYGFAGPGVTGCFGH